MHHSSHQLVSAATSVSPWLNLDASHPISLGQTISCSVDRKLAEHEHLFLEGDAQTHVYVVTRGVIGTYKLLADGRRQICSFAYPGDILGLECVGSNVNNAEALQESVIRCIPVHAIDKLIMTEPGFGQALLQITAIELAGTREQLLSLGRKSAAEKLATFLLNIARRQMVAEQPDVIINLPMKRCDIADFLGLTVETVSRNFTRLKTSGVIRLLSTSTVKIENMDLLASIAAGDQPVLLH